MTPTIENIVVLLLVAAAAVYMVVRLRRVAAGQSKCVCGSNSCGPGASPCGSTAKDAAVNGGASGGLPVIASGCNGCGGGCGKD